MKMPRLILDKALRKNVDLSGTPLDRFEVRVAHTAIEHAQAYRLAKSAYVAAGISSVRGSDMRILPQHLLEEATVLVAYLDDRMVGTMTVFVDSPAGLPLDADYPEEMRALREAGGVPAEFCSVAVVQAFQNQGVTNLINLAALRLVYELLPVTHVVLGINPRARDHFRAVYAFEDFGKTKRHASLTAPVCGVVQEREALYNHFRRHFRRPMHSGVTALQHIVEGLPSCIELPEAVPSSQLGRWKMPRAAFQQLFVERTDKLDSVNDCIRNQVERQRSRNTLVLAEGASLDTPTRQSA